MPRMSYDYEPETPPAKSRTELALEIRCPLCKAKPGESCRYAKVKKPNWRTGNERMWKRYELNGLPTDKPHIDRYNEIGGAERRRREKVEQKRRLEFRAAHRELTAATVAIREFDRHEAEQLAFWFKTYGSVFQEITPKESHAEAI